MLIVVAGDKPLIVQVARGSAVDRQLRGRPPHAVVAGDVVIANGPADASGSLEPPDGGVIVLSVPSPETLARELDEVQRVIARADAGAEPLVVVVEAAEELRDDELAVLVEATRRTSHQVILRIMRVA